MRNDIPDPDLSPPSCGPEMTRRGVLRALGGAAAAAALPALLPSTAEAAMRMRRVRLLNVRSGERADTVYMENGVYIPEALGEIDYLLRDLRTGEMVQVETGLVDLVWQVQRLIDTAEPLCVTSGYRSPATNRRLVGQGAARNSLHMDGMAVDVFCRNRSPRQVAGAARRLARGGVGEYGGFVHLDVGPVRAWRRG